MREVRDIDPDGPIGLVKYSRLTTFTVPLEQISYVDYPEIRINEHERTEMPFRYVKDAQGEPIMPKVSIPPA